MTKQNANRSISCSVSNCKFNCACDEGEYCSLECINVGTHELNPTEIKCTDCESFILK